MNLWGVRRPLKPLITCFTDRPLVHFAFVHHSLLLLRTSFLVNELPVHLWFDFAVRADLGPALQCSCFQAILDGVRNRIRTYNVPLQDLGLQPSATHRLRSPYICEECICWFVTSETGLEPMPLHFGDGAPFLLGHSLTQWLRGTLLVCKTYPFSLDAVG